MQCRVPFSLSRIHTWVRWKKKAMHIWVYHIIDIEKWIFRTFHYSLSRITREKENGEHALYTNCLKKEKEKKEWMCVYAVPHVPTY